MLPGVPQKKILMYKVRWASLILARIYAPFAQLYRKVAMRKFGSLALCVGYTSRKTGQVVPC